MQAQIVDLLRDLQPRHGLAYLFISHDLRVVRALAHDLIVMKDGTRGRSRTGEGDFLGAEGTLHPRAHGRRFRPCRGLGARSRRRQPRAT